MPSCPIRVLALSLTLVGCGEGPDPDVVRADSAGVELVTSGGSDRSLPWRFAELFRIGGADTGAGSFSQASRFTVETPSADRVVVFNRERSAVEVYDASGALLRSFGRPGGGPGEITFAFELLDAGPGEVAVLDYGKMAMVRWSPDGAVLDERKVSPELRVIRGDTAWGSLHITDSTRSVTGVIYASGPDTLRLDSLVSPPRAMVQLSCFAAMLPPMFSGQMVWDEEGGVVALTPQTSYLVQLYRGDRLVRSIRRPIAPQPTTPEMARRQHPDGWSVSFSGGSGCTLDPAEVVAKTGMAPTLPVVQDVAFGPRGTLWVQRHAFPGDTATSDVFDQRGEYLGSVRGRGLPLGWLGEDRVLFAEEDPTTGIVTIAGYRILDAEEAPEE